ncbi:hypothetical protein [Sanguibacter suarezii]|uniref:hypothetical protein n=1 Tax=Sanguibacter suarezii TaxID=60921 RepID=UPI00082F2875|nr:hypothetical protein [Sanguibacter suarezii]
MTGPNSIRHRHLLLAVWVAIVCAYIVYKPVSNNFVLYPMLISVVVISGIAFVRSDRKVDRSLVIMAATWALFVAFGVTVAVLRGAESWVRVLVFTAFWPALFALLVLGFRRWAIRILFWAAAVVTVFIGGLFIVGALTASGRLPFDVLPTWVTAPQTLRYVIDAEGVVALSAHALPSLLWWAPMWIATLFCGRHNKYLPPTWLRILAAGLAVAGTMVAWRRGIVVAVLLTPVLILVAWLCMAFRNSAQIPVTRQRIQSWLVPVAGFLAVAGSTAFLVQTELVTILARGAGSVAVTLGFDDPSVDPSSIDLPNLVRSELTSQDDQLADALRVNESNVLTHAPDLTSLLFGRGFGASIDRGAVVRDMAPWQTELQYHMLFSWAGLVGVLLLLVVTFFAVKVLRKAFRREVSLRGILLVSVVGALATLVGNATNPYMQAPGHMWPVFLPLMVAAVMLRSAGEQVVTREEQAPRVLMKHSR